MQSCFRSAFVLRTFFITGILLCILAESQCQVIYVNNAHGSDSLDGLSSKTINDRSGPFLTISRALERVKKGGTIIITNTGKPYYESLQMVGKNGSGFHSRSLQIVGNGVVVDGSRSVPPKAWKQNRIDLWSLRPRRKGHYQLILNGEVVPEFTAPATTKKNNSEKKNNTAKRPEIPVHKWIAWKGGIYYRTKIGEFPAQQDFRFAYHPVGLTLYNVHDVKIENMTFRYFQLDGINAHSRCRNLKFNKIHSHGNGRSGFFVGGTSDVAIAKSNLKSNRKASLLIRGLAGARVQETEIDGEPQFIK